MNITFSILGFDLFSKDKTYGIHFLSFRTASEETKSFLGIHYWDGELVLSICFMNIFLDFFS